MSKIKLFFNKNYKILILIFSINPIINIIFDDKSKGFFFRNSIYFYLIGFISIIFYGLYLVNNERILNKIQIEKITLGIFALSNVILSFYGFGLIYVYMYSLEITLVSFVTLRALVDRYSSKINLTVESKPELYESRIASKDRILIILKNESKSLILVDGEWGIGKTFFMDRVLDEGQYIIDLKVDVLLFNEKKQMINFVMEEIHKVLLEKGIRSTSIRKYLSVINEGIENKFVKGLYKLFSDEKTESIEKDIKDDIKSLNGEKLVVIVDNLERTLDKKITINILGFLHYIYEKLGVNVAVLADSDKLRNEISRENENVSDYLNKFFIETIFINPENPLTIVEKLSNNLFIKNINIQQTIENLYRENYIRLNDEITGNINEIRRFDRIINNDNLEVKDKAEPIRQRQNMDEVLKRNRNALKIYNADYDRIIRKFQNQRTYESVEVRYSLLENEIKSLYKFIEIDLEKYENIILRITFYKEIYGNMKFEKTNLKENYPLAYKLLFDNESNDLGKNIIETLINVSNNDIIVAINMIENTNNYNTDIKSILKNFEIYFIAFYNSSDDKKMKLIDYYKKNYEFCKNNLNNFIDKENSFEGFAVIDRMYFLENNESILSTLFEKEISYKNRYRDTGISKEIIEISEELLDKVYKNDKDKLQRRNYQSFANFYMWCNNDWIEHDNEVIHKNLELANEIEKNTASNTNLSLIEKKYLEYFIKLFRYFFDEEFKVKNRKELEKDLFEHIEKININKNLIIKLEERIKETIKIDDLLEFERLKKELFELDKELEEKLHDILSPLDFPLEKNEDLEWRIELWKKLDEKAIEYYEYTNYSEEKNEILSKYYEESVKKGFELDEDFDKILKKANINIFLEENIIVQNEENNDI